MIEPKELQAAAEKAAAAEIPCAVSLWGNALAQKMFIAGAHFRDEEVLSLTQKTRDLDDALAAMQLVLESMRGSR